MRKAKPRKRQLTEDDDEEPEREAGGGQQQLAKRARQSHLLELALDRPAIVPMLTRPTEERSHDPRMQTVVSISQDPGDARYTSVYRSLHQHMMDLLLPCPHLRHLRRSELRVEKDRLQLSETFVASVPLLTFLDTHSPTEEQRLRLWYQLFRTVRLFHLNELCLGSYEPVVVVADGEKSLLLQLARYDAVLPWTVSQTRRNAQWEAESGILSLSVRLEYIRLAQWGLILMLDAKTREALRPARLSSLTPKECLALRKTWNDYFQERQIPLPVMMQYMNRVAEHTVSAADLQPQDLIPAWDRIKLEVEQQFPMLLQPTTLSLSASKIEPPVSHRLWPNIVSLRQHFWAEWELLMMHQGKPRGVAPGQSIAADENMSMESVLGHLWLGQWNFQNWVYFVRLLHIEPLHADIRVYEAAWMFLTWLLLRGPEQVPAVFFPLLVEHHDGLLQRGVVLDAAAEILRTFGPHLTLVSPLKAALESIVPNDMDSVFLLAYALAMDTGDIQGEADVLALTRATAVLEREAKATPLSAPEWAAWRRRLAFLFQPLGLRLQWAQRAEPVLPLPRPDVRAVNFNSMREVEGKHDEMDFFLHKLRTVEDPATEDPVVLHFLHFMDLSPQAYTQPRTGAAPPAPPRPAAAAGVDRVGVPWKSRVAPGAAWNQGRRGAPGVESAGAAPVVGERKQLWAPRRPGVWEQEGWVVPDTRPRGAEPESESEEDEDGDDENDPVALHEAQGSAALPELEDRFQQMFTADEEDGCVIC